MSLTLEDTLAKRCQVGFFPERSQKGGNLIGILGSRQIFQIDVSKLFCKGPKRINILGFVDQKSHSQLLNFAL
jgi:hypothetical protein